MLCLFVTAPAAVHMVHQLNVVSSYRCIEGCGSAEICAGPTATPGMSRLYEMSSCNFCYDRDSLCLSKEQEASGFNRHVLYRQSIEGGVCYCNRGGWVDQATCCACKGTLGTLDAICMIATCIDNVWIGADPRNAPARLHPASMSQPF